MPPRMPPRMNVLTGDLGNSRSKFRAWSVEDGRAPRLIGSADFDTAPGLGAQVRAWRASAPRIDAVALANVASPAIEAELLEALAARAPDPGLAIACRAPERVGRDRLFAARGALELLADDAAGAIVIDAGTALTVDAVRADRVFLGGAIAPGPALLAQALADGTARLPRVTPRTGVAALGRDTEEALLAGVVIGFRGAARELARAVAEESGLAGAPLFLTGGACGFLIDPPVFPAARHVEDLVHLGLLAACRDSASP